MADKIFRILAINPGSTSTKASIFENDTEVWKANIVHSPEDLEAAGGICDQGPFRRDALLAAAREAGQDVGSIDAVVGVGGVGLAAVPYGTYVINDTMVEDARVGKYGVHPNNSAVVIAREIADACGASAFAAGMGSSEEFQDVAHVGGFKETPRRCCVHMLNTKEQAIRHAAELGRDYKDLNLVVAHVGGGITVAAHQKGRVIEATDGIEQDGPFTPNRPGRVGLISFVKAFVGAEGATAESIKKKIATQGGLVSHLGTDDALEVKRMIEAGDEYAALVYEALFYNVANWIGYMATSLKGDVDGIILTGGLMNDEYGSNYIKERVKWIAPVDVRPGELEGEALASAALRVLRGEEELCKYTGIPVWDGFDHLKRG
ncbi:butyrate kinase [Adlercreutzia sp. R21]|uniref:butyrate kinase n=1 Tax=Adlercreutzia wanghongyangiae TaxID=3111451 RepID=UPI002DC00C22|nr:butyrate kinase [Adlercreutzia sp. R21]MEC4185246.1 butyrate kinase [Adlercreutzia sp. R21]